MSEIGSSEIGSGAQIDPQATVGSFCLIGERVRIGAGCRIGNHVVLHDDTVIGRDVRIDDGAVVGKMPMRARRSAAAPDGALPGARIGDACILGSHAVIYRGADVSGHVLIADFASVRERAVVGEATIIGRGVTVEDRVHIGARCKIESEAYIAALSSIGDDCFVAPCVTFTNDNYVGRSKERLVRFGGPTLERGARVAANSTLLPGVTLGEDCLVGAGSVVTGDVEPMTVVFGNPARARGRVATEQLLDNQ